MVYPEHINLKSSSSSSSTRNRPSQSSSSWCSEPLETISSNVSQQETSLTIDDPSYAQQNNSSKPKPRSESISSWGAEVLEAVSRIFGAKDAKESTKSNLDNKIQQKSDNEICDRLSLKSISSNKSISSKRSISSQSKSSSSSLDSEVLESISTIFDLKEPSISNQDIKSNTTKSAINTSKPSINVTSSSSSINGASNQEFIQDRIRQLVEAFSTRTNTARECIENPATPSSAASRESIQQPQLNLKPKLSISFSNKYIEELPKTDIKRNKIISALLLEDKIIDPNGKKYIIFMSIAAIAVVYNVWVIPLRNTFPCQDVNNRVYWMTFDYLADFVYLADMLVVQPRVKYLQDGFWVTDGTSLRNKYFKSKHFKLDLLSVIPLDILYFYFGPERVALRFPRYLKLHTFWEFFNFVDQLLSNPYLIRITRSLLYMMYLIHLNACAYYSFSVWEGIGSNDFVFNGKGSPYIVCFYFATKTATSIGKNPKPTEDIEYLFMTFSWLMGVFVFAVLIGQLRDIFSTAQRAKTEYRKLMDETLRYMRKVNLPPEMQRRVLLWFNYTWKTQRSLDENKILDCLPHKLKTDISINVHYQTLNKVKLFADCDEALLRELVLQLKSEIFLPGDMVCKKGDVGKEMYIIKSGRVQVIGPHEEVLATLTEGSVFGEISLLGIGNMNRRTADVRSEGYSNLFVLKKEDLNSALSHYPEAQQLLNKKAQSIMKKNASLERKKNPMIVIKNPKSPKKHAKFLETVLQVIPQDSKTNKLLRYGSRMRPRGNPEYDKLKYRNSLPIMNNNSGHFGVNRDIVFSSEIQVHPDNSRSSDINTSDSHVINVKNSDVENSESSFSYEIENDPKINQKSYDQKQDEQNTDFETSNSDTESSFSDAQYTEPYSDKDSSDEQGVSQNTTILTNVVVHRTS